MDKTREIKFRFYSNISKTVSPSISLDSFYRSILESAREDGGEMDLPDYWIPMQFTGLKDKNGKEIYEGDIVKHSSFAKSVAVEYQGASFLPFDEGDFGWTSTLCEVIGNIYENPELLK